METLTKWFQSGDAEKFFNGVTTSATKALGVIKTMTAGLVWAYDALNWVGETAGGIAASAVL